MVIFGDYSYEITDVIDNSFSIIIKKGSPAGLIFVGDNNSFQGYLQVEEGMNSIPLAELSDSVNIIDLGVLKSTQRIVTSTNNPFENGISLSSDEKSSYKQLNAFFSAIIQNPDINNDGQIDFLQDKLYTLQPSYHMKGGSFSGII